MNLLNIATTIIGFICFINGTYLSTEISAIASKRGLQPWITAAHKRSQHFTLFYRLTRFPSEILRFVHDHLLNRSSTIVKSNGSKNKNDDDDQNQPEQLHTRTDDEFILETTAKLFSFFGFCIMIGSFFFQIFSANISSSQNSGDRVYNYSPSIIASGLSFFAWLFFVLLSEPAYLYFPWHCLLGESLFLLWIGELAPLVLGDDDRDTSSSSSYSELLLRVLLARLMWGFSKTKFLASEWNDRYYLLPFLRSMPMPNPIGINAALFLEKHLFGLSSNENNTKTTIDDEKLVEVGGTIDAVEKMIRNQNQNQNNHNQQQQQQQESLTSKIIRVILVKSYIFFFFAEVISPFFILLPSRENWYIVKLLLGPGSVFALMSGIQLTGNFGFFPFLTATLCFPAFGSEGNRTLSVVYDIYWKLLSQEIFSFQSLPKVLLLFIYALHTTYSIFSFPLISWFAPAWTNNLIALLRERLSSPSSSSSSSFVVDSNNNNKKNFTAATNRNRSKLKFLLLVIVDKFLAPFMAVLFTWRIVHPYGIFPPHTFPGNRLGQVYEWSIDGGKTFHKYRYKYQLFINDNFNDDDDDENQNNNNNSNNKKDSTKIISSSRLFPEYFGSFVPFIHPHLDWASFYPFGFSGGGSMINSLYFVNVCPFRNYDIRLPVRVAHCLADYENSSRVMDFFEKSSLPPSSSSSSTKTKSQLSLLVRSRGVVHVAPYYVSAEQREKYVSSSSCDKQKVMKPIHYYKNNTNNSSTSLKTNPIVWYEVQGPMYVAGVTKEDLNNNNDNNNHQNKATPTTIPDFVKNPVRDIEWIHPEYCYQWRYDLIHHSSQHITSSCCEDLFLQRAGLSFGRRNNKLIDLAKKNNNNDNAQSSCNALSFIKELRKQILHDNNSSSSIAINTLCRSFINQTEMFMNQQQFQQGSSSSGNGNSSYWVGKDVVAVGSDMYYFALQNFGSAKFSQVSSRILALTHFIDVLVENQQEQHGSGDDYFANLFFNSKASSFLRHLSCLMFVVLFLSRKLNEEEYEKVVEVDDDDVDENKTTFSSNNSEEDIKETILIQTLAKRFIFTSSAQDDADTDNNNNNTIPSITTSCFLKEISLASLLGRITHQLTKSQRGPCWQVSPNSSSFLESPSTITAVMAFVTFHTPSIRQEASNLRVLTALGLNPHGREPAGVSGLLQHQGYLWFFMTWLLDWMPWKEHDHHLRGHHLREHHDDHSPGNSIGSQSYHQPAENVERAPFFGEIVSERFGTQHMLLGIHEVRD